MNCIAGTPCSDESYLGWLSDAKQQSSISTDNGNGNNDNRCSSDRDCQTRQFCNHLTPGLAGYCGECLSSNGMGCAMEEVCSTNGCYNSQEQTSGGVAKCYNLWDLDQECGNRFNDMNAKCNVGKMECESQASSQTQTQQEGNTAAALPVNADNGSNGVGLETYQNSESNSYFCGDDFTEVTTKCLQSKVRVKVSCVPFE